MKLKMRNLLKLTNKGDIIDELYLEEKEGNLSVIIYSKRYPKGVEFGQCCYCKKLIRLDVHYSNKNYCFDCEIKRLEKLEK